MVYIILGSGFEELEAIAPGDILRRGGVEVTYAGVGGVKQRGAHGIEITASCPVSELSGLGADDLIIIPGGMGGVESIEGSGETMSLLANARDAGAKFAAICAGPRVLARLGMLEGRNITCYPTCGDDMTGAVLQLDKSVVQDGDLITGRAPGSAIDFGLKLLEYLKGAEAAKQVGGGMYYG